MYSCSRIRRAEIRLFQNYSTFCETRVYSMFWTGWTSDRALVEAIGLIDCQGQLVFFFRSSSHIASQFVVETGWDTINGSNSSIVELIASRVVKQNK